MKLNNFKPIALALLASATIAAHAGTLTTGSISGSAEQGVLDLSGSTQAVYFTALPFSFAYGATQLGYCVDPTQEISADTTYTNYSLYTGAQYLDSVSDVNLSKLYSENNNLSSATAQAAFQMAVWEISTEHTGVYNVYTGSTSFSGSGLGSSIALAQTWLNELSSVTTLTWDLFVVQSPTNQDLLWGTPKPPVTPPITTPVPEPATYALMLAGLVGIGMVSRRRKSDRS